MKISVCSRCRRRECDGKEWRVPDGLWTPIGRAAAFKVCTSETSVKEDGKRYFHYVMGHGNEWDVEVQEIQERQEVTK